MAEASKNPYNDKSYTELLGIIRGHAKKVSDAALSVAKVERDPKTKREVIPPTDDAGLMIQALSVFRREYAKAIKDYGGSDEQVSAVKALAGEARSALRLAIKKMEELTRGLTDADEFLDVARDSYFNKHSDELEEKAKKLEERAKKAQADAALIRQARAGKGRRASA